MNLKEITDLLNEHSAIERAAVEARSIITIADIKTAEKIRLYNRELKYSLCHHGN
jgi:hypothetical protein